MQEELLRLKQLFEEEEKSMPIQLVKDCIHEALDEISESKLREVYDYLINLKYN